MKDHIKRLLWRGNTCSVIDLLRWQTKWSVSTTFVDTQIVVWQSICQWTAGTDSHKNWQHICFLWEKNQTSVNILKG